MCFLIISLQKIFRCFHDETDELNKMIVNELEKFPKMPFDSHITEILTESEMKI
jgi:hypothetical protein